MSTILSVEHLTKRYESGHEALTDVNLQINEGEILALLGPNGAGKTTLISIICGIVNATEGRVMVAGHDNVTAFRKTRSLIGLVPQELTLGSFDRVSDTVNFSRGLFGKGRDDAWVEQLLTDLSLWDKRDSEIMTLSGGMKRRVLIAKALAHKPRVLFLDEPTAGVDVELRKDMWEIVSKLRKDGVTIILTTHYIEEAEAIADRVGVISKGKLLLVEDKATLMQKLGKKQLIIELRSPATALPGQLNDYDLELSPGGDSITYTYDVRAERTGITRLLQELQQAGLELRDLQTRQSSLEEIFVNLVNDQ